MGVQSFAQAKLVIEFHPKDGIFTLVTIFAKNHLTIRFIYAQAIVSYSSENQFDLLGIYELLSR